VTGGVFMRRNRIEFDGAVYHVIQRSSNREKIFGKDTEKEYFLDLLAGYKKKFGYRLFGYVLMDNHYHLLLQTGAIPLNKIMQRINFLYSKFYNQKNSRHGHVFGGRYKAGLVQDESYLFAILRYIHQNPVRANICINIPDYHWSSDHAYRNNIDSLCDIDFILDTFSHNRNNAIKTYRQMMGEMEERNFEKMKLIGHDDFVESKRAEIKAENSNLGTKRKTLEEILKNTVVSETDLKLVRTGSRRRALKSLKKQYIIEAAEEGYTQQEIGSYIKISGAAVNKIMTNQ
jgi:putative transposase